VSGRTFNVAAVDERDMGRRASLRRVACALEADADRLVPVEYR
jgi:hypothetical protein